MARYVKDEALTMSMYVPALAIARYSPSCEKLRAFIAFLKMDQNGSQASACSGQDLLAGCDCTGAYPFCEVEHIDNGVISPGCKISMMFSPQHGNSSAMK